MLGILKAGGAYVPLDPDHPDKRLSFMIRDAGMPVIVAHRSTASRLAPALRRASVLWIDEDDAEITDASAGKFEPRLEVQDLACVIYSASSTGFPQGVLIGHRSVLCLARDIDCGLFGADEVVLQHAPISSDASIFEIWGALVNGGRLVLMPQRPAGLDALGHCTAAPRRHNAARLFGLISSRRRTAGHRLATPAPPGGRGRRRLASALASCACDDARWHNLQRLRPHRDHVVGLLPPDCEELPHRRCDPHWPSALERRSLRSRRGSPAGARGLSGRAVDRWRQPGRAVT